MKADDLSIFEVEAKSSSSGSCGKFIEVVIMLILIGSYYCFIHGYYCSTTVNTARTKLMLLHRMLLFIVTTAWYRLLLLVIFSAALHGWYYMLFVATVGEEYEKVFNHLDMLQAPLEGKCGGMTWKFKGNLKLRGSLFHSWKIRFEDVHVLKCGGMAWKFKGNIKLRGSLFHSWKIIFEDVHVLKVKIATMDSSWNQIIVCFVIIK
ncbi:hypothetical protein Tco_0532230 [Tanacetum coccineum]